MSREWKPAISECCYDRQPPIGALIGVQHKVWRVTGIETQDPGDWNDRARDQWVRGGMKDPWHRAPFRVLAEPPSGGPQASMLVQPWRYPCWFIVPEHYAVCAVCAEPAPCADHLGQIQAMQEMTKLEEAMALPDGYCPACSEPITTRQKTHLFPGPNLLNPFGAAHVAFHARRSCRAGAARYEERWVAAEPGRERSLLTLKCTGRIVTHADGSAECDRADCPNIYAHHSHLVACYMRSAGCPRVECAGSQHGCTPASGLRADGSRP